MQLFKRRKTMSNLPIVMDSDGSEPPFGTASGTVSNSIITSNTAMEVTANNQVNELALGKILSPYSPDGKYSFLSSSSSNLSSTEEEEKTRCYSSNHSYSQSAHQLNRLLKYNSINGNPQQRPQEQIPQLQNQLHQEPNNTQLTNDSYNHSFRMARSATHIHGILELIQAYSRLSTSSQDMFLSELLQNVSTRQLSLLSNLVMPRLKVDIVRNLPREVSLYILSFLPVNSLCRLSCVSKFHSELVNDSHLWRNLCTRYRYKLYALSRRIRPRCLSDASTCSSLPNYHRQLLTPNQSIDSIPPASLNIITTEPITDEADDDVLRGRSLSFKMQFKKQFMTKKNWRTGRCSNRMTIPGPRNAIVTTLMFDENYMIMGTDNTTFGDIQVFDSSTGQLLVKLTGHEGGVWALDFLGDTLVSGGCDRDLRVWDLPSGLCKFRLEGHSSTIRCLKMIDETRALTGSRDHTIRLWDLLNGECLHVFRGHSGSIRCLAIHENLLVSGSYDNTLRIWNLETKSQVHLLNAHHAQIYSVDFNGKFVCSGSLDADVRVWDAETGRCLYTLEGHDALVGHVQIHGNLLATAGSDGRVCIWNLETGELLRYINAYLTAVSALQFDEDQIVTGGDDGVKIWDVRSGQLVRKAIEQATGVWRLQFNSTKLIAAIQNGETTLIEIMDYEPRGYNEASL